MIRSSIRHFGVILIVCLIAGFTASISFSQEEQPGLYNREFTPVTDPIWTTPAKSQGRTGTCWCFSTTSFVETEAYRKTGKQFELSEIFTVYNMYLEKAIRFIRLHSKAQFGQGGLSHDMLFSIPKYGMVRESDYSGLKEGETVHNHSDMFKALFDYLMSFFNNGSRELTEDWINEYQAKLTEHLGAIPEKISYEGKEITPTEFATEVLEFNPDDYVEITSYTHMPFYTQVELLIPDNWLRYEGYYNVPLDEFIAMLDHALENGYSVVLDLDVSEKTKDREVGVSWTEHDLNGTMVTQEQREAMFNNWSTTDDHLEHTVGVAKDQDGRKYYYTKDSGGPGRYKFDGFNYLSENYVRAKVLAFLVHKDGISDEMKSKLGL